MSDKEPIFHDDPMDDPAPHPHDDQDTGVAGMIEHAFRTVLEPIEDREMTPEERKAADEEARE